MNRVPVVLICAAGVVLATPCAPPTPVAQSHTSTRAGSTAVTVGAVPNRHRVPTNPRASRSLLRSLPPVWSRLAWCESRWHLRSVSKSGKHHGLFQIHEGWFKSQHVNWRTATATQQYRVALHVYKVQGARAWSCARSAGLR